MTILSYQQHTPKIDKTAYISPDATVIGDVVIGKDSSVWPKAVMRADEHKIRIGNFTNIQDGCIIHVSGDPNDDTIGSPTLIGDHVSIGHGVILHGCTISNRVLIGIRAVVLDNAFIAEDCVVGAGSIVYPGQTLESGNFYHGNPVECLRPLTNEEYEYFQKNSLQYAALKDSYSKQTETL